MKRISYIFPILMLWMLGGVSVWGQALNETEREYLVYTLDVEDTIPVFECTIIDCQDPVDLGLPSGLKWATCNIGATSPEDYGAYFAWGETIGYRGTDSHNFSRNNYAFYQNGSMTKYNATDKLTTLELGDDAARANWQGDWRMPTADEWKELINNCRINRMVSNGTIGLLITGPNSNSIFLPLAGYREGWDVMNLVENIIGLILDNILSMGSYWSSSLATGSNQNAQYFYYTNHLLWLPTIEIRNENRYLGRPIRAVCDQCE